MSGNEFVKTACTEGPGLLKGQGKMNINVSQCRIATFCYRMQRCRV